MLAATLLACTLNSYAGDGVERQRGECEQFDRQKRRVENSVTAAVAAAVAFVGFRGAIAEPVPDSLPSKIGAGGSLQAYNPANGQYVGALEATQGPVAKSLLASTTLVAGAVGGALAVGITATDLVCSSDKLINYAGEARDLLEGLLP